MKKLFLLLSAGLVCFAANAQQTESIVLTHALSAEKAKSQAHVTTRPQMVTKHQQTAAKTTGIYGPTGAWFNFFDQLATGAGAEYYFNTYQDSTVFDNDQNANMFFHGLGVSFDPTDSAFSYTYQDPNIVPINFMVTNANAYDIDSVYLIGKYMMRNPAYVDTLIMELVVAGASQTDNSFLLQFIDATNTGYSITADGKPRFASAIYSGTNMGLGNNLVIYNQISDSVTAVIQRDTIILNSTVYADTDASGNGVFQFNMSAPLSVPAGAKVLAYAHFKSGHVYPFNTTTANANYFHLMAGDPVSVGVFPPQSTSNTASGYNGSYQAGLAATNQNMYNDTAFNPYMGHNMLIPNFAYDQPPQFDAPDFGFFVKCTTCFDLSVNNVKNIVSKVSAYPSPANDNVNISFTLGNSAAVTVTLTNEIGQVVRTQNFGTVQSGIATLNTSNLSGGLYFYTVNAGGQRSTGKVLVAH